MFQRRIVTVAIAVSLATAVNVDAQRVKLSKDMFALAKDNNEFAYNLYANLKDSAKGNMFFSPYSISTALGMTYGGARGDTATQMATTLNFKLDPKRLHPAFGELVGYLNATGKMRPFQLSVANALWGQEGFNFNRDFVQLVKKDYRGELAELNFKSNLEGSRLAINDWVEKKTNNKIKDLIPKGALNVDTRLVLTNAIYFKSGWTNEFPKRATKAELFAAADGKNIKTPMMHKSEKAAYTKNDDCEIVNIPYSGHALSMIVFLPNKKIGLVGLEKKLTTDNVNKWLKGMKRHQVDLKLPKFKMTSKFNLSKVLANMGMPNAFSQTNADFSGMSTEARLFIQQVLHKAFVDVHEKGTEAAAATGVVIGTTSIPPPLPKATFHADRSFVFLIRENRTGSVLFMGRITEPTSN